MPIKQNAKKAARQAIKHAERNVIVKNVYKKAVKVSREALVAGEDAKEKIRLAQKALDKAVKRGVVKANTASRKLSRLMQKKILKATAKKA